MSTGTPDLEDRDRRDEAASIASYLFEIGLLKNARRTGWWIAGVKDPETIAEHSFRTAVLATVLAAAEDADTARAAQLALFHDTQETRTGDVPHIGRRYLSVEPNPSVTKDQVAALPTAVAQALQQVVDTYEAQDTPEARIAKEADRLECLIQALEYRHQGYTRVQEWIDNCRAGLTSATALQIADAAERLSGLEWQHPEPTT
jgi:putative hydrolases of HD superfamily